MRSALLFLIATIAMAALSALADPASAGWGGTHAGTMVYPQYVYYPPYRSKRRGCRARVQSCAGDPHDAHLLLQHNPRAYYRFRSFGFNW